MSLFALFETSLGFCLFEVNGYEEIEQNNQEFVQSILDYKKISKIITLKAFFQFKTSDQALENVRAIIERKVSEDLSEFLKFNLKISKKNKNIKLATCDKEFSAALNEAFGIEIVVGDYVTDIFRAIRTHLHKYLNVSEEDLIKSQLGLGHSYSRMKCTFDVNRQDKPIVQSIALIDQLDKNINSFCMRIKEWFGWHFPELARIVSDNTIYVKIIKLIETRNELLANSEELTPKINEIVIDEELTKHIIDAAHSSMGCDLTEVDLMNVKFFCDKVLGLIKYREELSGYLKDKMKKLAPNTSALVGETVGARLISHAGSLSNLAKYPASTIQILGAEKALFRALKTKGKTPKYGLLYHSSYIGKAPAKNKGKVSRYLANKLAVSSRIDYFSNDRGDDYGLALKSQVEERLDYLAGGKKPKKNVDVMKEIFNKLKSNETEEESPKEEKLLKKKTKRKQSEDKTMNIKDEEVVVDTEVKKKKKKKVVVENDDD